MTHCSGEERGREGERAENLSRVPDRTGIDCGLRDCAGARRESGEGVKGKVTNAILNNKTAMRLLLLITEEGRDQQLPSAVPDTFPPLLVRLSLRELAPKKIWRSTLRYISLVDNALSESGAFRYTCSIHNGKSSHHLPAVCLSSQAYLPSHFADNGEHGRYSIREKVHSLCHLNRKLRSRLP